MYDLDGGHGVATSSKLPLCVIDESHRITSETASQFLIKLRSLPIAVAAEVARSKFVCGLGYDVPYGHKHLLWSMTYWHGCGNVCGHTEYLILSRG
jgi:hypothetical protein